MGFLARLFRNAYTLQDWSQDLRREIGGRRTLSGVHVSEESALRYITVYSCVRVLAETLASLPLFVYRERKDGGRDKARDHPLFYLLHDAPNDEMTSLTWRETTMGHLTLSGNTYSIIQHNGRGEVIDIYPLDWHLVQPVRNRDTGRLEYQVMDRGKPETFPADQILHIPLWGFDGIKGYSTIRMAEEAVGVGIAIEEFSARFFGQGMNVGGLLEHPGELSDVAFQRLQKWIEDEWSGLENSWKPLILEGGMKFSRVPMPLREAQFVEKQKLTDTQICGLFRVPPHMVANLERATFSNVEHLSLEFVMYTMLPYLVRYEQAINRRLFSRQEREQGYYVKFNIAGLLRGDYKSRQEGLALMRQNGVINADEWRELEEMNPQPGGIGKVYLVNGNMKRVDEIVWQGRERG